MSTGSLIGKQNSDGSVAFVYCHSDGYLKWVGAILLQNYSSPAKVDALLAEGDVSSIGAAIGEQHPFNDRPDGVCTFYGRDRGETGIDAKTAADSAAYLQGNYGARYFYLLRDTGWVFSTEGKPFEALTAEAIAQAEE